MMNLKNFDTGNTERRGQKLTGQNQLALIVDLDKRARDGALVQVDSAASVDGLQVAATRLLRNGTTRHLMNHSGDVDHAA